jgi:hypothetical protein
LEIGRTGARVVTGNALWGAPPHLGLFAEVVPMGDLVG